MHLCLSVNLSFVNTDDESDEGSSIESSMTKSFVNVLFSMFSQKQMTFVNVSKVNYCGEFYF